MQRYVKPYLTPAGEGTGHSEPHLIPWTLGEKAREVLGIFLGSIIKEREEWLG